MESRWKVDGKYFYEYISEEVCVITARTVGLSLVDLLMFQRVK